MPPTPTVMESPAAARSTALAVKLVSFADLLGLIPSAAATGVGTKQVKAALDAFAGAGVGRRAAALGEQLLAGNLSPRQAVELLEDAVDAIEQSPLPELEWMPMATLLGDELLESLIGASVSSVRRYRSGERPTPDHIAQRLHAVSLIAADLAGSYNGFGIRRWFGRSRTALSGRSPSEILAGDWDPAADGPSAVQSLAASLLAPMTS